MSKFDNPWEKFMRRKAYSGGAGKTKPDDQRVHRRSITATDPEWEYVKLRAKRHGISCSQFIRMLIAIDRKIGGVNQNDLEQITEMVKEMRNERGTKENNAS